MVKGTIRSINPLAYYVNNVSDLDKELVTAYKKQDKDSLQRLLSKSKYVYDVFLCVNKHWHAFILCVIVGGNEPKNPFLDELMPDADSKPFDVPDVNLCYRIELVFDEVQLKTYKIEKKSLAFKNVKHSIHKSYYVGKYKGTSPYGLELAILRAAPHRYQVLLDDCVEFAKEFCIQLLAYCENWREIEEDVENRIKNATGSGFSVEMLSRRVQSSAILGSTFLGGMDVSSFLSGTHSTAVVLAVVVFLLTYPVLVTLLVVIILKYYSIL
ncbi:uncharacterized protein LOC117107232 [Anneissia japonica]|uniref:uncharacterized protein LOC117107232 n=1 Tax=Anneissia japonica TaxID=1529436 RepID=UPI001425987A|nr:uncharacterized protein LOC117107232 [Anneissia japonica]